MKIGLRTISNKTALNEPHTDSGSLYCLSHSMQRGSGTTIHPHIVEDIQVAIPVGTGSCTSDSDRREAPQRFGHVDDLEDLAERASSESQSCRLAHDFPQDVLLIIFSFAIWHPYEPFESGASPARRRHIFRSTTFAENSPFLPPGRTTLIRLASVCAYWRFVCLATPPLWSSITEIGMSIPTPRQGIVVHRRTKLSKQLCYLFLERSNPAPFSLILNADLRDGINIPSDIFIGQIIQACAAHRHRWQSLCITSVGSVKEHFDLLFNDGSGGGRGERNGSGFFPHMENLILRIESTGDDSENHRHRSVITPFSTILNFIKHIPSSFPKILYIELSILDLRAECIPKILSAFSCLFPSEPPAHTPAPLWPAYKDAYMDYDLQCLAIKHYGQEASRHGLDIKIMREGDGTTFNLIDVEVNRGRNQLLVCSCFV